MLSNCSARELATAAHNIGQVGMTEAATLRWTGIYTALAVGVPSDETNYELRIGTNYAPALVLGRMDRARTGRLIRICRPRLWPMWSVNRVAFFVVVEVAALGKC